jgi:acetyl-CoA carboxylase biotin carboxylase subunit
MLKASAGGGGIGMALCKNDKKLREAFDDGQKKGAQFFGSSELLLEKYIESPHHVEVQVLGDTHGNIVHLFDRECSVQRRHQKVVEEAKSPFLHDAARRALLDAGVKAARTVGYVSAGTIEFVADAHENVFFLEMNTRLQVEHPVTEMITGIDIVEQQLRIATGERLPFTQDDIRATGHAIEVRLCAEDPEKRFFPSPGRLETVRFGEGEGIRVDSGVESGSEITPYYDSLFAKVISHGETRDQAIERLADALSRTEITGTKHNLALHQRILADETFRGGTYTTNYLADVLGVKS